MKFHHEFVEHIPRKLEDGILYVSIRYGTAVHCCACGCGEEVVTPFGPAEWEITYDGHTVSIAPSIGNWSSPCRSHYWITKGLIRWAKDYSETDIISERQKAKARRRGYYQNRDADLANDLPHKLIQD